MPQRELRRPLRVIDLHGDEGDLEVAREPLGLVQVHGLGARVERVVRSGHRDALAADGLHLLGPGVHDRDVVTGAREKGAQVTADRPSADEEHLLGHRTLPDAA